MLVVSACADQGSFEAAPQRDDGVVDVVTSTALIADLAKNVAGDRARVTSLMPPGADPHAYEPSLRTVRNVANADIAFMNYLLLEQQSLFQAITESSRPGTPVVRIAEEASEHGANIIPLVEDVSLDTVWLGMRIIGTQPGELLGSADAANSIELKATAVRGPGDVAAYLTGTFGQPVVYFNSADGVNERDRIVLPAAAHTHMSWAFSKPGVYELDLSARFAHVDNAPEIAHGTVRFAVGIDPHTVAGVDAHTTIIDQGHQDIAVDVDNHELLIHGDEIGAHEHGAHEHGHEGHDHETHEHGAHEHGAHEHGAHEHHTHSATNERHRLEDSIISIPGSALQQIPATPAFRFLGRPGSETYMLAQAVLGKHVHGEWDPHLWHDVGNAIAYVKVIRDHLIAIDPDGAPDYTRNAQAYIARLNQLDSYVREQISQIPADKRYLVTTHDGYGYLAKAYGLKVAGFISPNPAVEPSARDLIALTRTLENLQVPAVFLEPQLEGRATNLSEMAKRAHVDICRIYGDSFTEDVRTYVELMEANARSLKECLAKE
ncbi:metal ABC transporter solute-binding protein, Zn/Mn family [Corynebacterium spheniscorum]|uniref:metal ABC transporter solute-binding protein, Zn/Mn family n=1 Tax=Corynebacterium spheniscorum TaxID=185761 RepID=UPI0015A5A5E9|nr:zinc ABC transporter substrate-binding protein [Corynebacterium spheniscorum]